METTQHVLKHPDHAPVKEFDGRPSDDWNEAAGGAIVGTTRAE